ncbi:MAG: hypothetical protein LBJ72_07715, partial [Dysgonamonadaceae bacterium]|nr:hypothetical protein [Dysgonamonadaceae bacterium]
MKQTTHRLVALTWMFLLASSIGLQAQKLSWVSENTYAHDVNVGYSGASEISFRFEVQDAGISNAVVKISLPNSGDIYTSGSAVAQEGSVSLGNPAWNAGARTITFPAKTLTQGQVVYYKLSRSATTAINNTITASSVTVEVTAGVSITDNKRILDYNYNRAALSLSGMTTANQTDFALSFGNNTAVHRNGDDTPNTPQSYKLSLSNNFGSVDSVKLTITLIDAHAGLSNWTINPGGGDASPSKPVRYAVNKSVYPEMATYTLVLMPADLPGGDGFNDGESVEISVDVMKEFCGNADLTLTAYWGNTDASPYHSISKTGVFTADGSGGGTPSLVYTQYWLPSTVCYDGSPTTFTLKLTNTGTAGASGIKISGIYLNGNVSVPTITSSYIDETSIRYKINHTGTWNEGDKPPVVDILNRTTSAGVSGNYVGKPNAVDVSIPATLNPGDTLYVECGTVISPEILLREQGVNVISLVPCYLISTNSSYSDLCHSMTGTLGQMQTYRRAVDLNLNTSDVSIRANETKRVNMGNVNFFGLVEGAGTAAAKFIIRVVLPNAVELSDPDPIRFSNVNDEAEVMTIHNFSQVNNVTNDSTIYTVEMRCSDYTAAVGTNFLMYLNLKNPCLSIENKMVVADISVDFYPTGSIGPGCMDVLFYRGVQFFSNISLLCDPKGVTYRFDVERMNLGFKDDDQDGIPNIPFESADPNKVDKYTLVGDSLKVSWNGEILDDGFEKLYIVLYSTLNQQIYSLRNSGKLKCLINGMDDADVTITLNPLNTITNGIPGSITTTVSGVTYYAYSWEIAKPGGFAKNTMIDLETRLEQRSSAAGNVTFKSYFYATISGVANALIPGTDAIGDEIYDIFGFRVLSTFWGNHAENPIEFQGIQTPVVNSMNNHFYVIDSSNGTVTVPSYEYRHLSMIDSIVVVVPEGYILDNEQTFTISADTKNPVEFSYSRLITASNSHTNTDTRKTFVFGPGIFDVNWDELAKVPLPNMPQRIRFGLKVSSTYSALTSVCKVSLYADNHTYTQSVIDNLVRRDIDIVFNYIDPGSLKLGINDVSSKPAKSTTMQWGITLQNTKKDTEAYDMWLYLPTPATNVALTTDANTYPGEGEGNRWIHVPGPIDPTKFINASLTFDYLKTDCSNSSAMVYPLFNRDADQYTNWRPYTDLEDASFSKSDEFVYPGIELILQDVNSRISGEITPLASTTTDLSDRTGMPYGNNPIAVGVNFPVELVFNTLGEEGSVINATATVNFFNGLKYVEGSACYDDGNAVVPIPPGSALETELKRLDGTLTAQTPLSLALLDGGISNGEVKGGGKAYLRFLIEPTCELDPISKQISAVMTGNKVCGTPAVNSGQQTYRSSYLKIDGVNNSFTADNTILSSNTGNIFSCQSSEKSTTVTYTFWKNTGADQSVTTSDSIRISVPVALNLSGQVQYKYPAVSGSSVTVDLTGAFAPTSNRIENGVRILSWPINKAYYDALATGSKATDAAAVPEFTFVLELDKSLATAVDAGSIRGSVTSESSIQGCSNTSISEVATDEISVTVNPTPIVDQPDDVVVCSGETVSQIDFTGNFTDMGYGYKWAVTTGIGSSIGMSSELGTGSFISSFTAANAISSAIVVTVTVTPTYGDCDGDPETFTITVNPLPTFTVDPPTICAGGSVNLTTAVDDISSGASVRYYTASDGSGSELTDLSLTVTPSATTTYYAQATNTTTTCTSGFEPITVTVNPLPQFTLSKTSERICGATDETLDLSTLISTGPTNSGVMKYYSNSGCTTVATNPVADGVYYLRAENSTTGCKSAAQSVTVDLKTPVSITTQPSGGSTCAGGNVTMTVVATGEGTLTYEWVKDGTDVVGTSASYSASVSGSYTVTVSGCDEITSNNAVVTINPLANPSFASGATNAAPGQSGMVYTTQSGMGNYVWGITDGTITSGGNGYNTATVTWGSGTSGSINVTYESAAGCAATGTATRPVTLTTQINPDISGAVTVCPVSDDGYTYTTDEDKFDYDWTITGGAITAGGDGSNTVKVEWGAGGTGNVSVSYRHTSDTGLPLVSEDIDITKQKVTNITTQPTGNTVCFGDDVSLSVAVDCQDNTATYQWKKGGVNVGTPSSSPGYPATESGSYTVEVLGICGTVTSSPAVTVTIKDKPTATLTDITSAYTTQEVTYTTDASSVGDTYHWDYTGATRVSGGTSTDKTITVKWTTTGNKSISVDYMVDGCPTTTATKNVTVVAQGQPIIDDGSPVTSVCFGASQSYATASNKYNYHWTVSGGSVATGQGTATATITWGGVGNGTVKVEYSEALAATAVESEETTVTINDQPSI